MSPFISIKEATKNLFGIFSSLASFLVEEKFNNLEHIQKSNCPCFILHGAKDSLIPSSHSYELLKKCK
jgi:hypothetical protein